MVRNVVGPRGCQAMCGVCRNVFQDVAGFDRHRRLGLCAPPHTIDMVRDRCGVWVLADVEDGGGLGAVQVGETEALPVREGAGGGETLDREVWERGCAGVEDLDTEEVVEDKS